MKVFKQVGRFALVATLAASTFLAAEGVDAASYSDVSVDHWAYSNIQQASEQGLMQGYPGGTFNPEGNVTRAEFLTVLIRTVNSDARVAEPFTDVANDYWGKDAIEKAIALGFINPADYGKKFNPDRVLTREEIAEWLTNGLQHQHEAYKAIEKTLEGSAQTLLPVTEFYRNGIKKELYGDVGIMIGTGLMTGDQYSAFNPKKNATRAEVATMILRYQAIAKKQANDFNTMNEIIEMSETGSNLESATGFTYLRGSTKNVVGKPLPWTNGLGVGSTERIVFVEGNTKEEALNRSVYAKMLVGEDKDVFAQNNVITMFVENTFTLQQPTMIPLAYGQGTPSNFVSTSGVNELMAQQFGYQTISPYTWLERFKQNQKTTVWAIKSIQFEKGDFQGMGLKTDNPNDSFSIKYE